MKRRNIARLATVGAAAAIALGTAGVAHADTTVGINYAVTGSTHIASTDSTIPVGPTTLSTVLNVNNGDITGTMPIPSQQSTFNLIGFVPVSATVSFVETSPLTGHIDLASANAVVTGSASYTVQLSNVKIAGIPAFVGDSCKTVDPVTIPANTPAGQGFDLLGGGELTGSFSLGDFEHCGINTWLINQVIPGSGNTVDLHVSNGQFVS